MGLMLCAPIQHDIHTLQELFRLFDADGGGEITQDELRQVIIAPVQLSLC